MDSKSVNNRALFDHYAKQHMTNWDLEEFSFTHHRLFKAIMDTLEHKDRELEFKTNI